MRAALTELGMIYYLKQWSHYLLLPQKPKCPSVPECVSRSVSVELKSLGTWLRAIVVFDSPLGFITSFNISKCGPDTSALKTFSFVRFGMLEYW